MFVPPLSLGWPCIIRSHDNLEHSVETLFFSRLSNTERPLRRRVSHLETENIFLSDKNEWSRRLELNSRVLFDRFDPWKRKKKRARQNRLTVKANEEDSLGFIKGNRRTSKEKWLTRAEWRGPETMRRLSTFRRTWRVPLEGGEAQRLCDSGFN